MRAEIRHLEICLRWIRSVPPQVLAAVSGVFADNSALGLWLSRPAVAPRVLAPFFRLRTKAEREEAVHILNTVGHRGGL
jgi:hypothetical protein